MFAVVIAWLKVNGIDRPIREVQPIDALAAELPDFGAFDDESSAADLLPFTSHNN
jgi:hypothetical protein